MFYLRKYTIYLLLVLTLFLQVSESPGSEQKPEPLKLKVLLLPFLSYAPLFIAEEEGYFAKQGLQIDFIRMERSTAAIPALVQGELDVLAGTLNIGLLNAIARGARVKFVADKEYIAPTGCVFFGIVVRRALIESGELTGPSQLKGRRIAVSRASPSDYTVEKLLNTAGLTLDDIIIVDMLTSTQPEAFGRGTIDAAVPGEPLLTRILESKDAVLFKSSQQIIPNFQHGFIVYGPTLLDKNPEIGRRFMVAYLKGVQQHNQGKTERNLEILAKHTGLDKEFLKRACWSSFHSDGKINIESVLDFQAWALKKGLLDKAVTPSQFWDPSFVDYANKALGELTK